ncbi:MAG: hypothetical protein LBQ23_02015 [Puniceicoccales bacterium]|nr:hypothetical protein [Puniceicoccales bacterium]
MKVVKIIRVMPFIKVVFLLFLCHASCLATVQESQLLLNIPINDFILPVFNTVGQKIWEVHGHSAMMIEDGLLCVKNFNLHCFTEEENPQESFLAVSDMAFVAPKTNLVSGNSKIKIFGQNFYASANIWEFLGDEKKIIAKDHVKVFLDCDLEECLREKSY